MIVDTTAESCTLFTDWNSLVTTIRATKSSTNPHFKNKFAPLDAWLEEIHRLASLHNFIFLESMDVRESETGDLYMIHTCTLLHQQGFTQKSTYIVGLLDKAQAMGANTTYARRYNIQVLLTCTGEDDDDGNIAQAATTNFATTQVTMTKKRLA